MVPRPDRSQHVSPLCRRSAEPDAGDAAALAKYEELRALTPAQPLPALGAEGIPHARGGVAPQALCKWLLEDTPGAGKYNPLQLLLPVREAPQRLEHASLVTCSGRDRATVWRITELGETSLTDGSVEIRVPR
jgi:hypothetical protein